MIWVAGCSPTLVSHSLRGVAVNLKATTLAYLAYNGCAGGAIVLVTLANEINFRAAYIRVSKSRHADKETLLQRPDHCLVKQAISAGKIQHWQNGCAAGSFPD